MEGHINDDLFEHIDGMKSAVKHFKHKKEETAEKIFEESFHASI